MYGPEILARFLSIPAAPDRFGQRWQYNSRSDRHSKVGCWGIAFDLLRTSALLRRYVEVGKVSFGINHEMRDFTHDRKKNLDLVIGRPEPGATSSSQTFRGLVGEYGIPLTETELDDLKALPDAPIASVAAVMVALEAKATMTAHVKSLPRLYDELNSSQLAIHGASSNALAIGYVQVNLAHRFLSSVLNSERIATDQAPRWTDHRQPADAERVIAKVRQLPRRAGRAGAGFDGLGVSLFDLANDGSVVQLVTAPPAPQPGDILNYATMISRMANEFDSTFTSI